MTESAVNSIAPFHQALAVQLAHLFPSGGIGGVLSPEIGDVATRSYSSLMHTPAVPARPTIGEVNPNALQNRIPEYPIHPASLAKLTAKH